MGAAIFFVSLALLLLAFVIPGVRVARRRTGAWVRFQASLMMLLALVLVLFVFAEDTARPGFSNRESYDVEEAVAPTSFLLVLGALWLLRRPGSRGAALAAPLMAIASTFSAYVCFLFTTN